MKKEVKKIATEDLVALVSRCFGHSTTKKNLDSMVIKMIELDKRISNIEDKLVSA